MINFSRLNKRIEILKLNTIRNAFGEQETVYEPQGAAWCSIEAKHATRCTNNITSNVIELNIRCRYSRELEQVTPSMAIKYNGHVYTLDSIIDKYQSKVEMMITCHRVM